MKQNIIIIGAGTLQLPLITTARDMGLETIVFDMSKDAPGMSEADVKVLMSTRDIDGCVREAKRLSELKAIHGVLTAGTDASRAVAAIATALNLPGIRYADAEAASNKVVMRKRLKLAGVNIPDFAPVWSLNDAREAADKLSFPLVIKPSDNMGARGVIKIKSREDIPSAYRHAKKYSPTGELVLEEFMNGPELSIDALAFDGEIHITGVADRIITGEPYFIEIGHNMPSALSEDTLVKAEEVMKQGMRALGIHTGAGKGDIKVTDKGIMVGEIAARLSGGFMSSHTYPLHSGVNLHRAAIQIALGERPDKIKPTRNRVAIERGVLSSAGKILSLEGEEEARSIIGVDAVFITRTTGDIIPEITSNIDKVGHIIVSASNLKEAENIAQKALKKIQVTTDPAFSVVWKRVEERARLKLGDQICKVCKSCDGTLCVSGIPGMGGAGNMSSFIDNSRALEEIRIVPRYIHSADKVDSSFEFLGHKLAFPLMCAPMTGLKTNMNGAMDEVEFQNILLTSFRGSGSIAWIGDGASSERYLQSLEALEENGGFGIFICKPRNDDSEIQKRFREAEARDVIAVGIDIDAISLKTMELKQQQSLPRNKDALKRLRDMTRLPFILKGIMSQEDAESALDIGVDAVVVSNHGGRVMDGMPASARVVGGISKIIAGRIPVIADGGIRSGQDMFKMIALGANAVLVGRPVAIAAIGGESPAVRYLISKYKDEFIQTMHLCGASVLNEIRVESLLQNSPTMLTESNSSEVFINPRLIDR